MSLVAPPDHPANPPVPTPILLASALDSVQWRRRLQSGDAGRYCSCRPFSRGNRGPGHALRA